MGWVTAHVSEFRWPNRPEHDEPTMPVRRARPLSAPRTGRSARAVPALVSLGLPAVEYREVGSGVAGCARGRKPDTMSSFRPRRTTS